MARAACAAATVLLLSTPSFAQLAHPLSEAPTEALFMPRMDWKMSAAFLNNPDNRFDWDTHWAGDFDLFTYPQGRATFLADYQALLGSQFRAFDPYQSNYLLEASGSHFFDKNEVAVVLSHISRHYGDRPKLLAVAENSLGPRYLRRFGDEGGDSLDVRVDVRKVIAHAYDDYTWIEQLELVARRQLTQHTALFVRGFGELDQVDPTIAGRGTQRGGRIEAGFKFKGANLTGAALELFAGGEQMIDADLLDRVPRKWAYFGFRLVGH
jgi:hypothetical protein